MPWNAATCTCTREWHCQGKMEQPQRSIGVTWQAVSRAEFPKLFTAVVVTPSLRSKRTCPGGV